MTAPVIFGCSGTELTPQERAFFEDSCPWGFILFGRNLETPDQIRALTSDLRSTVGHNAPIFIDQEGGRVARLTAPQWHEWAPPLEFANHLSLFDRLGAFELRYRIIAAELRDLGIDGNCAPMLDMPTANTHPIILNRCYGFSVKEVTQIGRAVSEGLLSGGVLPVIKHIPGHGRADTDSHLALPMVSASKADLVRHDFAPFRAMNDLPLAMTAHIVYSDLDAQTCATLSKTVVDLIRDEIGFDGVLMTDDLSMHALSGTYTDRVKGSLSAGCDIVLHCNGSMEEMEQIASAAGSLNGQAFDRSEAALARCITPDIMSLSCLESQLADLLKEPTHA